MKNVTLSVLMLAVLGCGLWAQGDDDFKRERSGRLADAKDALEGRKAIPLDVSGWLNTHQKTMSLDALKGKVVVLDFWGTW